MLNNQNNQNRYTQREINISDPIRGTSARSFEQTGRKHPINIKELIYHIFQQLYTYDVAIRMSAFPKTRHSASGKHQKPYHNPYTDSIIYKTNTGKTIQIPTNIQKTAIASWIKKRNIKELPQPHLPKKVKVEKMKYMPCIVAVIILILMYYVGSQGLSK